MAVQSATASQLRNFLRFTIHWHAEYSGTVLGLVRARIFPCPCVAAQARAGYIVQSNVSGAINHQEPPHGQFELASKVLLVAHFPEKVRDSWKTNSHEIALEVAPPYSVPDVFAALLREFIFFVVQLTLALILVCLFAVL